MIKISKKPIALAVAGLLGVSPLAFGVGIEANYGGELVPVFAQNLFNDQDDVAALIQPLIIETDGNNMVGYSLGMTITLTLNGGAVFGGFPSPLPNDDCGFTEEDLSTTPPTLAGLQLTGDAVPTTWTCTIATTNPNGSPSLAFTLSPGMDGNNLTEGSLLELDPAKVSFPPHLIGVKNIHGIVGVGGTGGPVTMNVRAWNPNTQTELGTDNNVVLATSAPGVVVMSELGDSSVKIDVGAEPSKALFSPSGEVSHPNAADTFRAGDIIISVNEYGPVSDRVECSGTAPTDYCAPDGFQLKTAAPADKATITVTGADFGPFSTIFLSPVVDCGSSTAIMTVTGNTATATVDLLNPTGDNTFGVCFVANGADAISAQSLSAQVTVDFSSTDVTDPAPFLNLGLLPMEYNGSVVDLYMVNPGSNYNQVSFMRWCNKSSIAGRVLLEGWDDDGVKAAGNVTFQLVPNECLSFTGLEMEQGSPGKGLVGALGAPTKGRWHIRGTGEFDKLVAYGLMRSGDGFVSSLSNPSTERNYAPAWVKEPPAE